jgi:hypothetical protein
MKHQIELAYVGIEVPDPASLTSFLADVVGLVPGEPATRAAGLSRALSQGLRPAAP